MQELNEIIYVKHHIHISTIVIEVKDYNLFDGETNQYKEVERLAPFAKRISSGSPGPKGQP